MNGMAKKKLKKTVRKHPCKNSKADRRKRPKKKPPCCLCNGTGIVVEECLNCMGHRCEECEWSGYVTMNCDSCNQPPARYCRNCNQPEYSGQKRRLCRECDLIRSAEYRSVGHSDIAPIDPNYSNWLLYPWQKELGESHDPSLPFEGDWQSLIDRAADTDQHALRRYRDYIGIATLLAERLGTFQEVTKISLFGTLAQPPYREPHPKKEGILRLHFPENIDLAIWVSSLENLVRFQRIRSTLLPKICDKRIKVTAIPIELHLFSAQTSEYLGCVCRHRQCPHKTLPCRQSPECGTQQHLKITPNFVSVTKSFSENHCLKLFER